MFKRLSESDRNYKITGNINGHDIEFISADRYKEILSNYKKALEALKFYGDADNYGHVNAQSLKYIVLNEDDMGNGEFQLNSITDDEGVGGKLARQTLKELGEL